MNYYRINSFRKTIVNYIKQFYVPVGVKFGYTTIVLLSIFFFKTHFKDEVFSFYIEITSVAAIAQQFFRYGNNYKMYGLKSQDELQVLQNSFILRSLIILVALILGALLIFSDRSIVNFTVGLVIGIFQVFLSNRYAFLTQNSSYLKSALVDPVVVQIAFSILLFFVGYNFIDILVLKQIVLFTFLGFILWSMTKIDGQSCQNIFVLERNELWAFCTNIVSIGGPMLALYILSSSKFDNNDILFNLKILERSIAISLLLPSILNPYFLKEESSDRWSISKIGLVISLVNILALVCFFAFINLVVKDNWWLVLLLLFNFIAPFGSFRGFKMCVSGYTNIIFASTVFSVILQWIVVSQVNSASVILYAVMLNYVCQYGIPIALNHVSYFESRMNLE